MKLKLGPTRVYYQPAGPRPGELLLLALLGVAIVFGIVRLHAPARSEARARGLLAAERADRAFSALRRERERLNIPIFTELDPAETGLIFAEGTSIATSKGSLSAKQTSANPNFAALIVQLLDELDVKPGEHVAVGYTGSFPALNAALLAAATEMRLKLSIVASAASSDYGASDPRFTWLDMERVLNAEGVFSYRAQAASLGGLEDRALGLNDEARTLLTQKIAASGAQFLEAASYEDALRQRIHFFEARGHDQPYRAYVNIGGGAVSLGRSRSTTRLGPGVTEPEPGETGDSVASYFLSGGVPVIHLGQVVTLAKHYGLPVQPHSRQKPGTGRLFQSGAPSHLVTSLALSAFVGAIFWIGRRARHRAPLGALPSDLLVESPPSRHARPPSAVPLLSVNPGPLEEQTLHSIRPDRET